jgi:hypothetical protein
LAASVFLALRGVAARLGAAGSAAAVLRFGIASDPLKEVW